MTAAAVRSRSRPPVAASNRHRLAEAAKHYGRPVRLPIVGDVHLPSRNQVAYFAGLGVIAALGIIEWPVALVIGAGHVIADQHWSGVAQGLSEAVEEA